MNTNESEQYLMQALFDTMVTHLRLQGVPALDDLTGGCAYRGVNGTKCAVGCLISEDNYTVGLENKSVKVPVVIDAVQMSLGITLTERQIGFLKEMQVIHDGGRSAWEPSFKDVAYEYNLVYTPPKE